MPDILLRLVEDHDHEALFACQADERARWSTALTPSPRHDRDAFTANLLHLRADKSVVARAIVSNGTVVGCIIATDTGRIPQITFSIDPDRWGEGLATAGLLAFTTSMIRRPLQARVAAGNLAAIRVLEKAGFAPLADRFENVTAEADLADLRYELGFFPAPTYQGPPPP